VGTGELPEDRTVRRSRTLQTVLDGQSSMLSSQELAYQEVAYQEVAYKDHDDYRPEDTA
jgi:hypothetical protein